MFDDSTGAAAVAGVEDNNGSVFPNDEAAAVVAFDPDELSDTKGGVNNVVEGGADEDIIDDGSGGVVGILACSLCCCAR